MPGLLPLPATLGLEAILLLVVSMTVIWLLLRTDPALASASAVELPRAVAPVETVAGRRIPASTLFFFLGAATVVEVGWRPAGLTVSDVCFLASFVCCCYSVLSHGRIERVPPLLIVGVCLFAVGGTASTVGAVAPNQSMYEVGRSIWVMLLWPWTAVMALRTRRDVVIAIVLWSVAGVLDSLGALGQATGVSTIAGHIGGHRATGFAGSPNDLGAATATLLLPVLALAIKVRARWPVVRALQWLTVALVATALVLSGSVSGLGGALVGLILWMVTPDVRRATRVAVVLGLAAALVVSSTVGGKVPSPEHRVQEVFAAPGSSPNAGSAQGHLDTIRFAWPRIRSNPVIGAGLHKANLLVHSGLVAAWYGGGILALIGLLLVFGAVLSFGWWAALAAINDADRAIAWALVCAVIAFFIYLANQPLFFQQYGFIASALLVAWGRRVADSRTEFARSVVPRAASAVPVPVT
jgi:hypothetical protein